MLFSRVITRVQMDLIWTSAFFLFIFLVYRNLKSISVVRYYCQSPSPLKYHP
jgi:hypothetical protein